MFALLFFFCSLVTAQLVCNETDVAPGDVIDTFTYDEPGTVTVNELFAITTNQSVVDHGLDPESSPTSQTPPTSGTFVLPNLLYVGCDFDNVTTTYYFIYQATAPGLYDIPFFNITMGAQLPTDNITANDTTPTTVVTTTTTITPTSTPRPKNCNLFPEQCVTTPAPTPPCPTPAHVPTPPCPTPPPVPTPPCPTPPPPPPPTTAPPTTTPISGPAPLIKGTTAPTKTASSLFPGIPKTQTTTKAGVNSLAKAATTQKPTTPKPTTPKPTTPKPTTPKPTTPKPTTPKPTTPKPTTPKPTTPKPTTPKPTTQKPTTQKPTTQKPTATTPKPAVLP